MEGRFVNKSFAVIDNEDPENSPENSCGSPPTAMFTDTKLLASTSSPRKSRRSIQKRVVSVPIKEVDGSRLKGEISNTPPSDSWAWRKYGQKPIKGSPYPRGYYRCSSSKGCPARKQVERSRDDPNMLLVTYSCEHNHSWPSKNNHKFQNNYSTSPTITIMATTASPVDAVCKSEQEEEEEEDDKQQTLTPNDVSSNNTSDNDNKFNNVVVDQHVLLPVIGGSEFGWWSDFESTSMDTMLETCQEEFMEVHNKINVGLSLNKSQIPINGRLSNDVEIMGVDGYGGGSVMQEEDELLFADLGELPECSIVFRRGLIHRDAERRTPWCWTTS